MSQTSKSIKTALTEGQFLRNHIQSLEKKQVTYNNVPGFFMSISELENLEAKIADLSEKQTSSLGPEGLIELNSQLQLMAKRAQEAELKLKVVSAALEKKSVGLEEANKRLEETQLLATTEKARIDADRSALQKELKAAQATKKVMHREVTDPAKAKEVVDRISSLQKELASLNAARNAEQAKVQLAFAEVTKLKADLAKERLEKERLQHSTFQPLKEPRPLEEITIDPEKSFGATLKKVFSTETLQKVKEAAEERRRSTRQYAYKLIELADKTDPKAHIGYTAYAKALFAKVVSVPGKERAAKYGKALDELYKSMAFSEGKKLKVIKKEFRELFSDDKASQDATKKKVRQGKYTLWEGVKHDFVRFRKKHIKPKSWWGSIKGVFAKLSFFNLQWWFADKE